MAFTLTAEQTAILSAAVNTEQNLMIQAYAGCAKTTTLVELAKVIPPQASLALAFNVKIKKELEARLPETFECKTLNGLGHTAWQQAIGRRLTVEERKLFLIAKSLGFGREDMADIVQCARTAKTHGFVPGKFAAAKALVPKRTIEGLAEFLDENFLDPEFAPFAYQLIEASITQALQGTIDYDDQIYMSALFPVNFKAYSLIMVDEAQDLSPLNHAQLAKMRRGRFIVCGDPKQAIYGFRGAVNDSMGKLRSLRPEDSWTILPLTLTFRCPHAVVSRQQQHAPGFTAMPAAPEGDFQQWGALTIDALQAMPKPVAILCRNNAPLVSTAFKLIKAGIGPQILGRDIGKGLKVLLHKIIDDEDSKVTILEKITTWANAAISEARAKEQEHKVTPIEDRRDCLYTIFEEGARSKAEAIRFIDQIFDPELSSQYILATGHKSKGLEWPTVVHLMPQLVPSKYARKEAAQGNMLPLEQDYNLKYVIETRAQKVLIEAQPFNAKPTRPSEALPTAL